MGYVDIRKRIVRKNRRICDNKSVAVVVELRDVLAECYTFRRRLRTNVPYACPHAQILSNNKSVAVRVLQRPLRCNYSLGLSRRVSLIQTIHPTLFMHR